jgi:predicted TPR repeat methyltransferase
MFRGYMLRELGRPNEAADTFRQGMDLGADNGLNAYFLASMGRHPTPPAPPRAYVERLFDDYASHFDTHLGGLGYCVPRVLGARLLAAAERFESALDMGCGTGLCGPTMKVVARRLDGVDLSAAMLEKARAVGVYDRLEHAELADHLQRTDRRYDLAVCGDVFGYIGALHDVFDGVARVLKPGGILFLGRESG